MQNLFLHLSQFNFCFCPDMSAEEKQQQIIKSGRRQRGKGGGVFPGAGGKRNEQTGKRKGKRQRVGNEGGIDGAFFADRQRDPFADMVGRGVRNFDFRLVFAVVSGMAEVSDGAAAAGFRPFEGYRDRMLADGGYGAGAFVGFHFIFLPSFFLFLTKTAERCRCRRGRTE